jgi:hypothetical protein
MASKGIITYVSEKLEKHVASRAKEERVSKSRYIERLIERDAEAVISLFFLAKMIF